MASGILSGLVLLSFAATSHFAPAFMTGVAILVVVGVIQAARMTLTSSLMMEYTTQEYRGRVMSIFGLNIGIMPAGVLPVTLVAERVGAPVALGIMAGILIFVAIIILIVSPPAQAAAVGVPEPRRHRTVPEVTDMASLPIVYSIRGCYFG